MKSDQFYLSSHDGTPASIADLLKRVARELRNLGSVQISELYLQMPYGSSDSDHTMFVQYSLKTKQQLKEDSSLRKWAEEEKTAIPTQEIELLVCETEEIRFNKVTVRMPQGDNQNDVPGLLEKVAEYILLSKAKIIHDMVYHDFSDKDVLDHPYVNIYLSW